MRRRAKGGAGKPRPAPASRLDYMRIVLYDGTVLERYVGADSQESAIALCWSHWPWARSVEIVRPKKVPVGNPTRGRIWESINPRGNVQGRG